MTNLFSRSFETLALSRPSEHVAMVQLNRPTAANAMNTQMGHDLLELWSTLYRDADGVRAVILTGSGERAFCAGADLKERNGMSDVDWRQQHALFEQMIRSMMDCPVPIIGAINGAAYAGGLEIALNADFLYAVPTARFAFTEVTLGIIPGASGTQHLPRAVGIRRAKEAILSGRPFCAEEAAAWGLINRICPAEALLAEARAVADTIAGNGPIAVRQAKQSINASAALDLKNGYDFEIACYARIVDTEDRHEGILAFNEKRRPQFKGR